MFNKEFALTYVNKLLKKHKITVCQWSVSSSGRAWKKSRKVKIPQPTNIDRFAVCLHEIFHIIGRKGSKSFEKEFYCDMYARGILIELGYDTAEWDNRTKWHILSRIAMAHNRGLKPGSIIQEIRDFFPEIDFSKWVGMKVFVGHEYAKSIDPNDIELTIAMTSSEVSSKLSEKGLKMYKSQFDDSTYGKWVVARKDETYGFTFDNLSEIVNHFKLAV